MSDLEEMDQRRQRYYIIVGYSGWIPLAWMIHPGLDPYIFQSDIEKKKILKGHLQGSLYMLAQ